MPESNMSQDWPASGAVLNLSTKRVVGVRAAKGQGEISEPVSPDITHGIVKEAASLDPPELAEPGQSRCVAADCEDAREAGSATNTPPGSNSDKPLPPRSQPATMGADQTAYYEALMLRAQEQRDAAMAEANSFQQQLYDLKRSSQREIQDLRAQVDGSAHKLKIEYELRTAAETKCSLMECELAELSSHIQFEAQNLVAQERREHRDELERLAKKQEEMVQLMEMERAQVESLKQSLESVNLALDRERGETERLRSEMMAFERKVSSFVSVPDLPVLRDSAFAESPLLPDTARVLGTASVVHGSGGSTPPSAANSSDSVVIRPVATVSPVSDPHIAGVLFFGTDATRTDTRLTEFLGFVNASSDKESMQSSFMQRSMREDVEPTLTADVVGEIWGITRIQT
ncbi:hypothetical protein FBU59_002249 [Linderina macrospora]|uniref:Uncharacterized protein n=1 Tax=Linderina macrospora TaxID=4868 RepID=A0ACC1JBW2_9FUNG|nr:hypothetical protein FBU59_002249 [Linderina macrospora]